MSSKEFNDEYKHSDNESLDLSKYENQGKIWAVNATNTTENGYSDGAKDQEYRYDEAIELVGTGRYTFGLLMVLSMALLAMSIDIFSFSTIVALSSCDFYLTHTQTHVLLSIPFIGPIIMAFPWGYISDTQGRRKTLLIAMSGSCLMSMLCAFAPNWITLAILKLIGTCFCSCAQSVCYTLLGESCCDKFKSIYLFIMTSIMHVDIGIYFGIAYFVGFIEFEYHLGFVVFVPWRLLVIILALPLGLSAFGLIFYHESPKFLLNIGKEDEALCILRKISRKNRGVNVSYPVKKVILHEIGNIVERHDTLLSSLWQQTAPLFQPPLLQKTVLLYCLIFITYSSSSTVITWLPFFAEDFSAAVSASSEENQGLCHIIASGEKEGLSEEVECTLRIHLTIAIFAATISITYSILNFIMSKFASRKKTLMISICLISGFCCIGALNVTDNIMDIIFFFGAFANVLCMGILFTYSVDFYPTSFRGMAASLGVMVARISSVFGVNFIGAFITWHCSRGFYGLASFIFCGAILSCFLPSDTVKKL